MRYIIYKSTDFLDSILISNNNNYELIRVTNQHLKSRVFNLLINLARNKHIFLPFILKLTSGFQKLKKISCYDILIVFDISDLILIEYLRKCLPHVKKTHVFYWNPLAKIFTNPGIAIENIKSLNFSISTFDKVDAEKYKIIYKHQFARKIPYINNKSFDLDFYYLGALKGRKDTLESIIQKLKRIGATGLIITPKSKEEQISYTQNIEYVNSTRCIIEIVQQGQSGITLRALEALFYQKKLITTCHSIKSYDFYSPNNILIWKDQEDNEIIDFLKSPYNQISSNIVENYTLENWVLSFK